MVDVNYKDMLFSPFSSYNRSPQKITQSQVKSFCVVLGFKFLGFDSFSAPKSSQLILWCQQNLVVKLRKYSEITTQIFRKHLQLSICQLKIEMYT